MCNGAVRSLCSFIKLPVKQYFQSAAACMRILFYQVKVWVSFAYRQRKCQLLFESRILSRMLKQHENQKSQHTKNVSSQQAGRKWIPYTVCEFITHILTFVTRSLHIGRKPFSFEVTQVVVFFTCGRFQYLHCDLCLLKQLKTSLTRRMGLSQYATEANEMGHLILHRSECR